MNISHNKGSVVCIETLCNVLHKTNIAWSVLFPNICFYGISKRSVSHLFSLKKYLLIVTNPEKKSVAQNSKAFTNTLENFRGQLNLSPGGACGKIHRSKFWLLLHMCSFDPGLLTLAKSYLIKLRTYSHITTSEICL